MMKHKIELIDFSVISTIFGKYLTVLVTLVVFAITTSALFSNESGVGGVLKIAVASGNSSQDQLDRFEPFGRLLSSEMRRAVEIVPYSKNEQEVDLYVLPLGQFIKQRRSLRLVPLRSLVDFIADEDIALMITAASNEFIAYDRLRPSDVAFSDSISANGFWLQLQDLEKKGFRVPERLNQLHFEGSENHSFRIVLGVQWKKYTLGACSMSDLIFLENHGWLERDEIRIVSEIDALPEILFAATPEKADYLGDALENIDDILISPGGSHSLREAVSAMQAGGCRRLLPVKEDQLERAERLVQYLSARF
jgi:ABC-type phosphate/phosphonate transport system substrate-binding protein